MVSPDAAVPSLVVVLVIVELGPGALGENSWLVDAIGVLGTLLLLVLARGGEPALILFVGTRPRSLPAANAKHATTTKNKLKNTELLLTKKRIVLVSSGTC